MHDKRQFKQKRKELKVLRKDNKNKNKPFVVKVAQIEKIVTVGLVGGSALILGEVFEKFLLTVPGMQLAIPIIGTHANMIGLFLGSLVDGLVGAIILNLIDKFIAKKSKEESDKKIIWKVYFEVISDV